MCRFARADSPGTIGCQAGQELIPFPVAAQGSQPSLPVAGTGDGDHGGHPRIHGCRDDRVGPAEADAHQHQPLRVDLRQVAQERQRRAGIGNLFGRHQPPAWAIAVAEAAVIEDQSRVARCVQRFGDVG